MGVIWLTSVFLCFVLNNVLTVFELVPVSDEFGKDKIKGIEKIVTCLVRAGDISKVILSLVDISVYSSEILISGDLSLLGLL